MQVEMLTALHKAMAQTQPGLLQVQYNGHAVDVQSDTLDVSSPQR